MKIVMIGTYFCPNCKKLAPIVEEYCSSHGITYEYHNIPEAPEDILRILVDGNIKQAPAFLIYGEDKLSIVTGDNILSKLNSLKIS